MVWVFLCLAGEFLLLQVLERVGGLRYLRWSTSCVVVLFPLFLLAEGFGAKVALLGALGFVNAGWYSILKAQLYAELPGRSGTVMALDNVAGTVASLAPLALGAFAQRYGLGAMMWLLLSGPLALLAGLLTCASGASESAARARAFGFVEHGGDASFVLSCEVRVPDADVAERLGRGEADHFVRDRGDRRAALDGRDREGRDDAGRLARPQRAQHGAQGRAGADAVVHKEDCAAREVERRARAAARAHARFEFAERLGEETFERGFSVARGAAGREFFIEDERARHAHGAHRVVRPARREQTADEHDIERRAQTLRHLRRDRHAAARDREHDRPPEVSAGRELLRQLAARAFEVRESHHSSAARVSNAMSTAPVIQHGDTEVAACVLTS